MARWSVLVTGGSGGIGRSISVRFAREGFTVVITYLSGRERALETARLVKQAGGEPIIKHLDVADPRSVEMLAHALEEELGELNVLVNNAGILQLGGIREMGLDEWEQTLRVNLTGPFLVAKALIPLLERSEWASIVNVASIAGETGNVLAGIAYSASKAGLIGLTKRLAIELASLGIRVNAVAPSFVETRMVARFIDTPEKRERVKELHPLRMLIRPEDVAEAVYFLAVPWLSRAITGHILRINAGRLT